MKKATVNVYAEDVVCIYANLDNFDGGLTEWKDSIYQLFRYNMTFDFAHRIDVREGRENGVYVYLVIRPAFQESLMNTMRVNARSSRSYRTLYNNLIRKDWMR